MFDRIEGMLKALDDFQDKQDHTHTKKWIMSTAPSKKTNSPALESHLRKFVKQMRDNPARFSKKVKAPTAPAWYAAYFGEGQAALDRAAREAGVTVSMLAKDPNSVFGPAAKRVGVSEDHVRKKFSGNGVALVTKAILDHYMKPGKEAAGVTAKMQSLIALAKKLYTYKKNDSAYTALYFRPKGPTPGNRQHLLVGNTDFAKGRFSGLKEDFR
eukprot:g6729.t1